MASFARPNTGKAKAATIASYRVSHVIAQKKKAFQDGDFVKEEFTVAADSMFCDFKNKREIMSAIKDIQLSRPTVTNRCENMSGNVQEQLMKDVNRCECFSLMNRLI